MLNEAHRKQLQNYHTECYLVQGSIPRNMWLSSCLLTVVASQGIVVRCTVAIFLRTVSGKSMENPLGRHFLPSSQGNKLIKFWFTLHFGSVRWSRCRCYLPMEQTQLLVLKTLAEMSFTCSPASVQLWGLSNC